MTSQIVSGLGPMSAACSFATAGDGQFPRPRRVPANPEDKIMITTAAVITQLLLMVYPGLVLHRALALRFLSPDAKPSSPVIDEVDLLAYGLLPGLAIVNTFGTVMVVFVMVYK